MNVNDARNNAAFESTAFSRTATSNAVPSTFASRRGAARAVVAVASTGLLVGVGAVSVSPALAALAPTCGVTVTATSDAASSAIQLQAALSGVAPVICLSGTFTLTQPLTFDRDLTLQGLSAETTLDGNDATAILTSTSGNLTVSNLSFENGNTTRAGYPGVKPVGGAIKSVGSVTVSDSKFFGNFGNYGGGAISSENDVSITASTFVGNATEPEGSFDGGAVLAGGNITVSNSTFDGNFATARGGALFAEGEIFTERSTFTGNTAANGGAIYSLGSVDVSNSTFVSNSATDEGGAILARGGDVEFSTFLNNTAATPVGGADIPGEAIYLELDSVTSDLILSGNIFAGSGVSPQIGVGDIGSGAVREAENNVFSTTSALEEDLIGRTGTSIFGASISEIFGASSPVLGDNGGTTETVALVAGSPAVDLVEKGEVVFPFGSLTPADVDDLTDQRGEPRVGLLDAGAFEFQPSDAVTPAPAPAPELAATGSAPISSVLGGFAALIIAVGAAFVAMARRQRVG
jgi:predicted outer membrane repeat protein